MHLDGTMKFDTPEGAADYAVALGLSKSYHQVESGWWSPGRTEEELQKHLRKSAIHNFVESFQKQRI